MLALIGGLAACAGLPPPGAERIEPPAATTAAPAPAPASASASASLQVLAFRGGRAAQLGHNHVLQAGDLAVLPGEAGPELRFRLDRLVIDAPAARAPLGEGFDRQPDAAAVAGTRANLLRSLEAESHPEVRVRALQQIGEGRRRAVEIEVSLHGQTHRQWIVVEVEGDRARGRAVIRQSDFGITPFSVLGGLLAVQDALIVEFDLAGLPAGR